MEVELQSRLEGLCRFKVLKTYFEATLDGLVGMVLASLMSLLTGKTLDPYFASMNSETRCAVRQNFALMQTTYICLALHTPAETQRKSGPPEQLNW